MTDVDGLVKRLQDAAGNLTPVIQRMLADQEGGSDVMALHDAEAELLAAVTALRAQAEETAKLKVRVSELTAETHRWADRVGELGQERERVAAENQRLRGELDAEVRRTKREIFAMAAMQGLLASGPHDCDYKGIVHDALLHADALLAALQNHTSTVGD